MEIDSIFGVASYHINPIKHQEKRGQYLQLRCSKSMSMPKYFFGSKCWK